MHFCATVPHWKGTKTSLITIKLSQIHTNRGILQNHSRYSGIPQTAIQKASGNIGNCSSTAYFQSMSEHKRRIKFLTLPPPPPSRRDDTANRIKWVTGLYDHYIKVVHMQNPQNMEKNYQRGCTICLWRKKQQLVQGAARCQPSEWQDGKWQETAFHSSNSKRNVQPVFSCLKTSRCCPLLTFPYLCSCNIWKLFYFYRGRGRKHKAIKCIYIFFSLREDVEWILIMIMRKKKKKNQQYLMWETFEIFSSSEEIAMFSLYKGCVWKILACSETD